MNIINLLQKRYSAKDFDSSKKLSDEQVADIKLLLQLAPSSTNIQPWHFILAMTDEGKARVVKSMHDFYSFNADKCMGASAVVVFATRVDISEEYLLHVLDVEERDGRFTEPEFKDQMHGGRSIFHGMHQYDYKDATHWAEKQVYLNLGNFLLGVAAMGLDALPMEGCDMKVLNEEFGLREKGFTASFAVAVGYHTDQDFNASLPKSRLPQSEIIEEI